MPPILYALKILCKDNSIKYKLRGKGIINKELTFADFQKLILNEQVAKSFFMLKKIRLNISKGEREQGASEFSIRGYECSRTLNKTLYTGRNIINDIEFGEITLPKGFNSEILKS